MSAFLVIWSSVILLWTWNLCRHAHSYMPMLTGGVHLRLAYLTAIRIVRSESKEMDKALYFGPYHASGFTLIIHLAQPYCGLYKPALL
jgi:exoribonuclease II